ncbi:MAG: pyrroloquinoline quinone biosynthesis peptide chaperone PqqD [Alphaproteobacteria bacterium]|nr:MAG: pyrroloquinoline quinone biosynthesis peptide chaperone PqqD [Alphaproteobacteria bacterium]
MARAVTITETSVPHLPRGVRLSFDRRRGRWVVLAPERVLVPDDIALEVLRRCDGVADVAAIVDDLATAFEAPRGEILGDVQALLQDLADKGVLTTAP